MRWRISEDVLKVSGVCYYETEAETEADAIARHEAGDSEFFGDEIEVKETKFLKIEVLNE